MSHKVKREDLEDSTYYLMLNEADKTAEIILTGKGGQKGYYFTPGVAKDYELANTTTEIFFKIPLPEGYSPL